MSLLFAGMLKDPRNLVLADYNQEMINYARNRLIDRGLGNINYVVAEAEKLPLKSNHLDCVCISFGFRNFTDKETALQEAYRILRPKGVLLILEFSKPLHPLISGAYKSFQAFWPVAGNILLGNAQPYQYLIESIEKHPNQGAVKQMLEDAKFQSVTCSNFLGGIAAIHKGHKSFG